MAAGDKVWLARGAMGPAASHGNTPASLLALNEVRRHVSVYFLPHAMPEYGIVSDAC